MTAHGRVAVITNSNYPVDYYFLIYCLDYEEWFIGLNPADERAKHPVYYWHGEGPLTEAQFNKYEKLKAFL